MVTARLVPGTRAPGIIALGLEYGDYVTLTADGANAETTIDRLSELLTTDHDA